MAKARQFLLLLWKNYTLQRRKKLLTLLEIGLPTLFALILIFIRRRVVASDVTNSTQWHAYSLSSLPPTLHPDQLSQPWRLFYTPDVEVTRSIMGVTRDQLNKERLSISHVVGFANESEMVDKILADVQTPDVKSDILGGIVFTNLPPGGSTLPSHIRYKIRLSSSPRSLGSPTLHLDPFKQDTSWKTAYMFPPFQRLGPRENGSLFGGDPGYWREGFLSLQHNIDIAIIKQLNLTANDDGTKKPNLDDIKLKLKRFPYPPYKNDYFVLVIQQQLPLVLMLSFVYSALSIVKDVVHEKERKLKELMKMMGLSNWLHWCAWFLQYFILLFFSVLIITVFFCLPVSEYGSVVGNTSPTLLLVFLLAYVVATINFCFAVSVFFNKANSAAAAGGIFFFVSYIPYIFMQPRYDRMTWTGKILSCLISNVGMAFGSQVIGMFEGTGEGVQWSNINQGISVDDDFTMLNVILMLFLDAILYALIAWYVEAVWPGEYGIPRPWYFPFMRSYWCGMNLKGLTDDVGEDTPLLRDHSLLRDQSQHGDQLLLTDHALQHDSEFFETEPQGMRAGIRIKNLKKVFGSGASRNVAVDGISLNLYEGQITALLGHNGAGKTTTMSMLTGFFPPTSGTAWVNGLDVRKDIDGIRSSLGLCPQQNVLFDTLTVQEHLVFFAKLKGYPSALVSQEVDRMLDDVGLTSKRHEKSQTLSGGMKRKLSVAIALVGGSQIVILDEPTSGMDPNARRQTWDILQHHRVGRTMVLTTHFMDEADLLGDRIAIMVDGQLQCCGSPLFLKKKYGAGYHMVIVKAADCDTAAICDLVQSSVPDAQLESNISAELSFILPHESKQAFEHLFTQLELGKDELKIASFGVSVTTMEEVFLRVGECAEDIKTGPIRESRSLSMLTNPTTEHTLFREPAPKNTGMFLFYQQFYAMFLKRVLHTSRNWLITVSQLAVPLFFTITALIILKTQPIVGDSSPLALKLSRFGYTVIPYGSGVHPTAATRELSAVYSELFEGTSQILEYITNDSVHHQMEEFLEAKGRESLPTYNLHYIVAAEFEGGNDGKSVHVTAYFNNQAYHSPGVTLGIISSAILRYVGGGNRTITTTNHPLPQTATDMLDNKVLEEEEGFTISFNVMFGMSFVASSFVLFLIRERATRAKHCQFVSGVHSATFWGATFCWDIVNYLVPCLCLLVTFAAFDIKAYVGDGRLWDIFLLFALYGWAMLPFMYILSFIFTVPSSGLVWLTMFNILAGIATVLAVNILSIPQLGTMDLSRVLEWVFLVLPNFCLGQGLNDFYTNYQVLQVCDTPQVKFICGLHLKEHPFPCCKDNCGTMCLDYEENYLSLQPGGIGRSLVFLAAQGYLYFLILFLIESRLLQVLYYKLFSSTSSTKIDQPHSDDETFIQEDGDVTRERHRIASSSTVQQESLVLHELTKYYGTMLAVDHLSVGIPQGECFGLLGINGAGKTTTFKMLTGDLSMSSGKAYLKGHDISSQMQQVRSLLGYCPQFDALIDQLTGREMLTMYARLRGVYEKSILSVISTLLGALLLEEHADKLIATYSGGNKRKLSTALALIGDPPIIFLDEPTTGMDPVARRRTWDVLSRVRASGQTLVLTSHSMEECEALCTRLAIMVNGQFKCLGSTQHLKNKFGEGFSLIVKVGHTGTEDMPNTKPVMTFIERTFPGSVLKDVHQGLLHYHVTNANVPWASLFGSMERAKVTYNIEDYSISQTTLEQVFINFARAQMAPLEERAGRSRRCWSACGACCATLWCSCCTDKDRHSTTEDDAPLIVA